MQIAEDDFLFMVKVEFQKDSDHDKIVMFDKTNLQ